VIRFMASQASGPGDRGTTSQESVFGQGIQAVRLAEIGPDAVVLVAGGAGSVSHYAIQLAKFRGARVITTISSDLKPSTHVPPGQTKSSITVRKVLGSVSRRSPMDEG
jgi:hypothetical protein